MVTINSSPKSNIRNNLARIPGLIENVVNQFIVRPTGNPNVEGVSGFVFDVVGTEVIYLDSDITDHYAESNIALQDHIALKPERFTLTGYVGELRDIFPNTFLSVLKTVQSLGTLEGVLPEFTAQATEIYGKIAGELSKVGQVINQARNIYDIFFDKNTSATRQQKAYSYFYQLWKNRQLCEIETPYGLLEDMAIESIQVKQGEDTNIISDFSVSFKKIRKARTIQFSLLPAPGKSKNIIEDYVNNGQTAGPEVENTLLSQIFGSS